MNDNARLGRLVLVAVIVVIALTELAVVGLTILAGTFRGGQLFGRAMLTGWLLWKVWDGAKWARWLMAGLFFVAVFGAVFAICSPDIVNGRIKVAALFAGFGVACAAISVGLALPCVGAYQAARREVTDSN